MDAPTDFAQILGRAVTAVLLLGAETVSAVPLAAALSSDSVVPPALEQREVDGAQPLTGLNFVIANGRIIVTGVNGDGQSAAPLLPVSDPLPSSNPDSPGQPTLTYAIDLWSELKDIPLHRDGDLKLPNGNYRVTHDNDFDYGAYGRTWVGFLNGNTNNRIVLTVAGDAINGTVLTPTHRYSLRGKTLYDLSQFRQLPFEEHVPHAPKHSTTAPPPASKATKRVAALGPAVVDVLVFFDPSLAGVNSKSRIRHIAALANQAYLDSGINLQIRLVGIRRLPWLSTSGRDLDNDVVLERMSDLLFTSPGYQRPRDRRGADLVTVVRPNRTTQLSCGLGYIGGAEGSRFTPDTGLAIVSDGIDEVGATSCDDYTFAHELGHNLGSAHDRANAEYAGHFNYSYGEVGRDNAGNDWYTIMSYAQSPAAQLVPKYSSPNLMCSAFGKGQVPCGTSSEDNVRSLNQAAPTVAAYRSARR